jgi:hypothetical protein
LDIVSAEAITRAARGLGHLSNLAQALRLVEA